MPDEPEQTTTDEAEKAGPVATETVETTTEVRPEPEPKHPLEEGGVRFNEVYGRMKAAEARVADLLDQLTQRTEPARPAPAAPTVYTADQLQAAVDQGRITSAQMAAQLAWQAKEDAKREITAELTAKTRRSAALDEVQQYLQRLPALAQHTSEEFRRVAATAYDIAEDTGLDVRDPRVQRRALRETLGSLDKLAKTTAAQDFARHHANITSETGGGGGRQEPTKDPLKTVPAGLKNHWDRLGYTKEQRLAELPYVNLKRWAVRG